MSFAPSGAVHPENRVVSIVRAVEGVEGIPPGFPILFDANMAIVEPAFRYLLDLAVIPGRSHAADTLELPLNLGDGVNQAANLASAAGATSIPSRNLTPLTTFGNWF